MAAGVTFIAYNWQYETEDRCDASLGQSICLPKISAKFRYYVGVWPGFPPADCGIPVDAGRVPSGRTCGGV